MTAETETEFLAALSNLEPGQTVLWTDPDKVVHVARVIGGAVVVQRRPTYERCLQPKAAP